MLLAPGIHLVHTRIAQSIVLEGPPLTLVDSGAPGSVPRLERALRRVGRRLADVEQLVLTHAHWDHLGSAAAIKGISGAQVLIHHLDRDVAEGDRPPRPWKREGRAAKLLWPALEAIGRRQTFEPVEIDGLFEDGDELKPGLEVIHTPGHSPGHCAVLIRKAGVLHVGDAVMNIAGLRPLPSFLNENDAEVYESFQKLSSLSFRRVSFGHGAPLFRGGRAKFERLAKRYRVGGR